MDVSLVGQVERLRTLARQARDMNAVLNRYDAAWIDALLDAGVEPAVVRETLLAAQRLHDAAEWTRRGGGR